MKLTVLHADRAFDAVGAMRNIEASQAVDAGIAESIQAAYFGAMRLYLNAGYSPACAAQGALDSMNGAVRPRACEANDGRL